jgi:hypothetical protein
VADLDGRVSGFLVVFREKSQKTLPKCRYEVFDETTYRRYDVVLREVLRLWVDWSERVEGDAHS